MMGNIADTIIFEQMAAEDLEPIYVNGIPVTPDEHYEMVSNPSTEIDLDRDMPNSIYIDSEEQKISQETLSIGGVNDEPQ